MLMHRTDHFGAFLSDQMVYPDQLRPHAVGASKQKQLRELSEKLVGKMLPL